MSALVCLTNRPRGHVASTIASLPPLFHIRPGILDTDFVITCHILTSSHTRHMCHDAVYFKTVTPSCCREAAALSCESKVAIHPANSYSRLNFPAVTQTSGFPRDPPSNRLTSLAWRPFAANRRRRVIPHLFPAAFSGRRYLFCQPVHNLKNFMGS